MRTILYMGLAVATFLAMDLSAAATVTHSSTYSSNKNNPAPKPPSADDQLKSSLESLLSGDSAASGVSYTVKNGRVTLTGTVKTFQDRRHIEDIVRQQSGVSAVSSHITVEGRFHKTTTPSTHATPTPAPNYSPSDFK